MGTLTLPEVATVGQFYALISPPGGSVLRAHFQRAIFSHRALGQELMLSPTESSSSAHSGGSAPTCRTGTDRGTVTSPGSPPCAWRRATGGAVGDNAGRWHGTPGSRGRGKSSSTTPASSRFSRATRSSTSIHNQRRSVNSRISSRRCAIFFADGRVPMKGRPVFAE